MKQKIVGVSFPPQLLQQLDLAREDVPRVQIYPKACGKKSPHQRGVQVMSTAEVVAKAIGIVDAIDRCGPPTLS